MLFVGLGIAGFAGLVWIAIAAILAAAGGRPWRLVAKTGAAVWTADLAALVLKALVGRPRPFESIPGLEPLMGVSGHSMPSGHAASSFAGLVLLVAAAPRLAPLLGALALAVGFSRVYTGVHYLTDVLAGAALGVLVGAAILRLRPPRWQGRGRRRQRLAPPPG